MTDDVAAALAFRLLDASIRWGLLIAALGAWFAIRPPRRAATRHTLCAVVLAAGPALAILPRWGDAVLPRPSALAEPAPAPTPVVVEPVVPEPAPVPVRWVALEVPRVEAVRPAAPIPPPAAPRIDIRTMIVRAVVGVWLAGALAMLARLGFGLRALARWAGRTEPATDDDRALLASCREALPTRRPVRLARHPAATSPAMVGGLRPTILLPAGWDAWPANRRRAGLLHELAHVRRYDDVARLAEELIRVPAWFHPLAAWLIARLGRERELLCDEAAVADGHPKDLARLLLELSRRPASTPAPAASLPFMDRRTTAVRIERLLEDDMKRTLSRPSLARTLIVGPLALAAALGLGGLRIRVAAQDAPKPAEPAAAPRPAAEAPRPADPTTSITCQVVDPEGRPIPGVEVLPNRLLADGRRPVAAQTDAEGRVTFEFHDTISPIHAKLRKPGYIPTGSTIVDPKAPPVPPGEVRRLTMRPTVPFTAVLVDEQDRPIAGATVDLKAVRMARMNPERNRIGADDDTPLPPNPTTSTAADGSFSFPYAADDSFASSKADLACVTSVKLVATAADGRRLAIVDGPPGINPGESTRWGFMVVAPGGPARLKAVPAARIVGRVVSKVPGLDLSSINLVTTPRRSLQPGRGLAYTPRVTKVDGEGRFEVDDLGGTPVSLSLDGEGLFRDWTLDRVARVTPVPGETVEATLDVISGVEVTGLILDHKTKRPAEGAQVAWHCKRLDGVSIGKTSATADEQGRYRVRLPAGDDRVQLLVSASSIFERAPDGSRRRTLELPEGVERVEVPPLEVVVVSFAKVVAKIRIVDAAGKPLAGLRARVQTKNQPSYISEGVTDADGLVRQRPEALTTLVGQPMNVTVTRPDGRLKQFQPTPAEDGLVQITLPLQEGGEFLRSIKGVVVDPEGRPVPNATVKIDEVPPPLGAPGDRLPGDSLTADAREKFRWGALPGRRLVSLKAGAPGFIPGAETRWIAEIDPEEVKLVLERPGSFGGKLVDADGRPVAGARVRVLQSSMLFEAGDGVASLSGFLTVSNEPTPATPAGGPVAATTAEDGSFRLPNAFPARPASLSLEVVTADGRRLSARQEVETRMIPGLPTSEGRPGDDAIGIPITQPPGRFLFRPGQTPTVTVVPMARIRGRAVVTVPGVDLTSLRVRVIRRPAAGESAAFRDIEPEVSAHVDALGQFGFDDLPEGAYDLVLHGSGENASWTHVAAGVTLKPDETAEASLEAIPGVEVNGSAVAGGADPAAGVEVAVASPASPGVPYRLRTDGLGRFTLRLPPGEATLTISQPAERFAAMPGDASRVTLTVPADGPVEARQIPVARAVTLHGRVVDHRGRPVVGAVVNAPASEVGSRFTTQQSDAYAAHTDARGTFRFAPGPATVRPGERTTLVVVGVEMKSRAVGATPDAEGLVEVVLGDDLLAPSAGVRVGGTVVESLTNQPVPGVGVEARAAGGFVEKSTTGKDGRYALTLPPGEARLSVASLPDGFASQPTGSAVAATVPERAERLEVPTIHIDRVGDYGPKVVPRR